MASMSSRDHMQQNSVEGKRICERLLLHQGKKEAAATEEEEKRSSIYDPYLFLAEELILFHILPYLPVKSVGRFRCVSRLWDSFLNSKRFIYNIHLSNAKPYPFTIHQYDTIHSYKSFLFNFLEFHGNPPNLSYNFSNGTLKFSERSRGILMFAEKKEEGIVSCLSSLHGLLCLKIKMYDFENPTRPPFLRVVNPVTREFLNIGLPEGFKDHGNICQLIFDPSSDGDDHRSNIRGGGGGHYKLLMVYNRDARSYSSKPKAVIVTLGVDRRWRTIVGPIFNGCNHVREHVSLPFVNGSVHWLWGWQSSEEILERHKDYHKGLVIAFNVRDEKFRTIKPPIDRTVANQGEDHVSHLIEFGGFLYVCVIQFDSGNYYNSLARKVTSMELWKLSDYENEAWNLVCKRAAQKSFSSLTCSGDSSIVHLLRANGSKYEFGVGFIGQGWREFSYDVETNELHDLVVGESCLISNISRGLFVESLVSFGGHMLSDNLGHKIKKRTWTDRGTFSSWSVT